MVWGARGGRRAAIGPILRPNPTGKLRGKSCLGWKVRGEGGRGDVVGGIRLNMADRAGFSGCDYTSAT